VPLMEAVVTEGTAYGIFLPADDVAAKTGTAQVGNNLKNDTDDWMIAFAPATDPTIAVAVSVPYQGYSSHGCRDRRADREVRDRSGAGDAGWPSRDGNGDHVSDVSGFGIGSRA
jgi:membrane peptidoglycan carboxypeptidase